MIVLCLLISLTSVSYGQTENFVNVDKVLQQLNVKPADCHSDLIVERVIPYAPDKSVVVIPKFVEKEEDFFVCDAYVLIIETATGKIINQYYEAGAWSSDAIRLAEISVDFAPYKLNATTRAFGIRTFYQGSSRSNPYSDENISLFIMKENALIPVLKNLTTLSYSGEWDTNCVGEFLSEKTVLVISDKVTNGFHDIIANNKITTITNTVVNDECEEVSKDEMKKRVLRFDGKEYK